MYKHILIPTDGSELSNKAVEHGAALAKAINAKVTIMTVSMPYYVAAVEPNLFPEKRVFAFLVDGFERFFIVPASW